MGMRTMAVEVQKKVDTSFVRGGLRHTAVHPVPEHDALPPYLQNSDMKRDFSQIRSQETAPLTTQVSQTNACPMFPRRCPFGGACHTCPVQVQTKLTINQPGDKYEEEADRIADQIMRMPEPDLQRQIEPEDEEEEEGLSERLQMSPLKVQRRATPPVIPMTAPPIVHEVLASPGRQLDPASRAFMESRFGCDLSQVRVHTDAKAAESSHSVNALAYTVGRNIVFNAGQYQPYTRSGQHLLAHELSHTIQQRATGPMIQRAMKFEFQTENVIWRAGGKKRKKLPRKFGPIKKPKHSRFLHKGSRGKPAKGDKEGTAIELQSEARGFVEFETPSWHRKWCAIKKRVQEAVSMIDKINSSKVVSKHGSVKIVEFPFDVKHLQKTKNFRTGLKAGEALEVEILDPTWRAKIQASESFELRQFESYIKEHLPYEATSITGNADNILRSVKPRKLPDKDVVNLRNFLQIIIEHLTSVKQHSNKPGYSKTHLAKEHIWLMSRTNFSSIYRTKLSKKERKLFKKIVKNNAIPKELGLEPKSRIFPKGFIGRKSPGPKLREWLVSIYKKKRDLLSSLGGDNRALGRFNVETEREKKHTDLVKFEARATTGHNASRPVTKWVSFAEEVFKDAHDNRSRTGSTELVYNPEECP